MNEPKKQFTLEISTDRNEMRLSTDSHSSDSWPSTEDIGDLIDLTKHALAHLERLREEWRTVGSPQPFPNVTLK